MSLLVLANSILSGTDSGDSTFMPLLYLVLFVVLVAGQWKTFKKAKKPGWAALIPFYNTYTILRMAGRPGWWLLLYFVPIVNLIVHLVVSLDVAKAFRKSTTFGIFGVWLFPWIGFLVLGFGDAKYKGVPKH